MIIGRTLLFTVLSGPLLLIPAISQADTIRCGTALIREGATASRIRENCGDPASVESSAEPVYERRPDGTTYQVGTITVDYWFYDFGNRRNPVRISMKGGLAEKVERLSHNQ